MNFNELIIDLRLRRLEYLCLLYANSLLSSHIIDSEYDDCLKKNEFLIRVNEESDEGEFNLSSGLVKNEINNNIMASLAYLPKTPEQLKNAQRINFEILSSKPEERHQSELFKSMTKKLFMSNAHFLRTRVINSFYETLKNWFSKNHLTEWRILQRESWNQILHLLRNIVSHEGGGSFNEVSFPKFYPTIVEWKTIQIRKGQLENTVRYNDKEILDLLEEGIKYLEINFKKYE